MGPFLIVIAIGVAVLFFLASIYNKLVRLRNQFKNSYAQIDVQLKRRYDLIPNLVNTAKGYMKHEKETLEGIVNARNQAVALSDEVAKDPANAEAVQELGKTETKLTGMLRQVFALTENYPDLKANTTMNELMEELTSTENKISFARQAYNDSVTAYNDAREVFPNTIVASFFSFKIASLLEVIEAPEERKRVEVSF